jgi:hypothetical protein
MAILAEQMEIVPFPLNHTGAAKNPIARANSMKPPNA